MGLPKLTEYMNVIIIVKTFRSAKLRKKSFLELHFGNNIAYNKTPTHTRTWAHNFVTFYLNFL